MVVGAIVSAMSSSAERGLSAVAMLCIWRLVLGVGMSSSFSLKGRKQNKYRK